MEGYVSIGEFKKLEAKVNLILATHSIDQNLTQEEQLLIKEAKKDILSKKTNFVSVTDI